MAMPILSCGAALLVCCGCDRILFGEKTTFAPGFSESKFKSVSLGLTVPEVTAKLGQPLRVVNVERSDVWQYSPGSTAPKTNGNVVTFDLFGSFTRLKFDPEGVVTNVSGDYLTGDFMGLKKEQVTEKAGKPNEATFTEPTTIFFYTVPDQTGGGTYRCRALQFRTNRVVGLISRTVYD